jgi:transcriptional antiterminator RfaH
MVMKHFNVGWYLIYTRPRQERKVHATLRSQDIDTFLPTQRKLRTWHDRKKYIEEPLFPSYVFVYLKDIQSYHEGMDADGALQYVRTGKEIARVNDKVVNNIKLATAHADGLEVIDQKLQSGEKAVIVEGPLTGLLCEIVQVSGNRKALVKVDLLRRDLLVSLPPTSLMIS